jgi:sigma-E factor negative regulatory protein RseC
VFTPDTFRYHVGQEVVVSASKDVANRALLLGFGLPFLLLVSVLLLATRFIANEGVVALVALGSLVPYYVLLWLFRYRIQRQISFQLED